MDAPFGIMIEASSDAKIDEVRDQAVTDISVSWASRTPPAAFDSAYLPPRAFGDEAQWIYYRGIVSGQNQVIQGNDGATADVAAAATEAASAAAMAAAATAAAMCPYPATALVLATAPRLPGVTPFFGGNR